MTDCCNSSQPQPQATQPKKHICPINSKAYGEVAIGTLFHHIKQPWNFPLQKQSYYFCDDPECDVVYFGLNNTTINTDSLRTNVGIKQRGDDALICYCFGVNRQQSTHDPAAKAFVIEQTKQHACSCSTSNPSGRCCLKDFPK